jgi:tetratricopeptide (TPR) repeat protein
VRIAAQLIDAANDRHLWADTYEGPLSDVLEVQGQVARALGAIVREGSDESTRAIRIQAASSHSVRPDAYVLYLKGRYFARHLTEAGQRRAIAYFQQSIDADPEFAGAYAGLAECFTELAYFFGMQPKEAFSNAEPAAKKAVDLDDTLAEGHAVLSLLRLLNDWDWRAADAESRRAIELAPGDAYVYWKRGVYLRYAGFEREAIAAHRQAESLDPFSLVAIEEVGWPLYYARRFDEAAEQFQKAVELESRWDQLYFGLGLTFVQQARHEEAIRALRTAADMAPENPLTHASLVYALGRAGRSREATDALSELTTKYSYVPSWFLSLVWVGLNQKERALASLEDAFNAHEPCLVSLKVDPVFDPLRDDRRFIDMVRRVGLQP